MSWSRSSWSLTSVLSLLSLKLELFWSWLRGGGGGGSGEFETGKLRSEPTDLRPTEPREP